MKLIHCADLHLDSRLQTHLDQDRAKRRRDELLRNFARLSDYADRNGVEAILIAGDLFDRDTVSALARNTVLSVIEEHPQIRYYYLRGNHDTGDCLRTAEKGSTLAGGRLERIENNADSGTDRPAGMPGNLFLFDSRWRTYPEGASGNITISGIELSPETGADAFASFHADPQKFNIVMLHGEDSSRGDTDRPAGGRSAAISLRALRGRGIDYLALGHIHAYKEGPLDARGTYCYPGCLEGRGFDESGPHGFVLLDIDEGRRTMQRQFIPFARRTLFSLEVDVTGCRTTAGMRERILKALETAGCTHHDMADVVLCGEVDVECEMDVAFLRTDLEDRFFFARVTDRTVLSIDPADYLYDESLRGEFVRLVMNDPAVPEEEKAAVIRCGFRAMDGEDPL